MSPYAILIALGALLFLGGIVGGGFSLKEIKLPELRKNTRILACVFGIAFMASGIYFVRTPLNHNLGPERPPDIPPPVTPEPIINSIPPSLDNIVKYGESYHLKNLYSVESYLDSCGGAKCAESTLYGVSTHPSKDRAGKGTGIWIPESATGKSQGEPVRLGDNIHLKNLYGVGSYLDSCGGAKCAERTLYGISTHPSKDRAGIGTGTWVFELAD